MKKLIIAVVITLAAVSAVAADTIYLRSGTTLRGTVLGFINGRFAVQLTAPATLTVPPTNRSQSTSSQTTRRFNTGEVIFLRPRDIERVELDGRSLDDARYQTRVVDVSLGPNWIDTGVDVRRGERIRVDASGTIYAGRSRITPAGLPTTDPSAPLPRGAEGELIGVIGNDYDSPIIEIGASREFVADRDGRLYMTINRSAYNDARGVFRANIRKEVDLTALSRATSNRNQNPDQEDNYDPFGLPDETGTGNAPARPRERDNRRRDDRNPTLEKVFDVPGVSRGVDTGIELRTGDQITITATGNITAGSRAGVVSADGGRAGASSILGVNRRPVPSAGVGALIGYILQTNGQMSQPFLIGSQSTLTIPADGRLFLLVNDDNYSDNSGSFSVRVRYPDNP
jgi:hypothetical protein